jgi:hypothetical protein
VSRSLSKALTRMQVGDSPAASIVGPLSEQARDLAALRRLEQADVTNIISSRPVAQEFTAQTSVLLGAFDGNNITGVRVSFVGAINGAGVGVAAPLVRLKPNNAASIPAQAVASRVYTPTPSYAATADATYGGAFATVAGLTVGQKSWAVNNGDEHFSFTGVFFTPTSHGWREWDGTFTARDLGADGNRGLKGSVFSTWQDNTTAVVTLWLSIDAGSLTGRVVCEVVP